jgi:hypothetical protein
MVLLKGKIAKSIQRKGSFGHPVILSHSLESIDPITVEFGTEYNDIGLPEELAFNTSNGTFFSDIDFSGSYNIHNTGEQNLTAVFSLIPVFKNVPIITATVISEQFLASSEKILASNNDFNIE